jgi:hypothetical protein
MRVCESDRNRPNPVIAFPIQVLQQISYGAGLGFGFLIGLKNDQGRKRLVSFHTFQSPLKSVVANVDQALERAMNVGYCYQGKTD